MNLTSELDQLRQEIKAYAIECGLDFFDVVFELCSYDQINRIASMGGFASRYPCWRFGMEYEKLSKSYTWGLSKIYEMVINTDPCYAYLMNSNPVVDQKLVMAHVYAHSDFFKNNCFFSHTGRKAMDEMANHGARISRYAERYGYEKIEEFLDCCLSVENLIDIHSVGIKRRNTNSNESQFGFFGTREETDSEVGRIRSKDYMEGFVNPQEFLDYKKEEMEKEKCQDKHVPANPERDVLLFLLEYAPLEPWQRDILEIVREEAYYFAPQWMTKIMNEGWASYWHSQMMTKRLCTDQEVVDFADHHSGTVAQPPGHINPYKIGIELFRDIEDRWNRGRHGLEWDRCEDHERKRTWDTKEGKGREKIFEVRRLYNDVTFIDSFLTPEFCEEHKLFQYGKNPRTGRLEILSREFEPIKKQMLDGLTNGGQPIIHVVDGNYGNSGELYLKHSYEGVELKADHARDTLKNLNKIWRRPVHIETVLAKKTKRLSYDGGTFNENQVAPSAPLGEGKLWSKWDIGI